MPRVLKKLDVTTLAIALDHFEENGPESRQPDTDTAPEECVYLKFIGDEQLETLADRLPFVYVMFRTMAGAGQNKVVRKLFDKSAIVHVLRFCFAKDDEFKEFVRDLSTVDKKYWRNLKPEEIEAHEKGE